MNLQISNISYFLPENIVTNEQLALAHPNWDVNKVGEKSGVFKRHIADKNITAFDLAKSAIIKMFNANPEIKDRIDGIIFCTQSPDYIMPSNAFLIHKEFGFSTKVWAFDYNLACSGYVYGLAIARGFMSTGLAKTVLLLNADTYSKYLNPNDRSTTVLFGDGAAASLLEWKESKGLQDIILETSGNEFDSFYIPAGGCRLPITSDTKVEITDHSGNVKSQENIHMNGFAVWKFISRTVPPQLNTLLDRNSLTLDDIDLFVFHQASKLTLDSLIKAMSINPEKVYTNLDRVGNTVSASIPIALRYAEEEGKLKKGDRILISGFGVGLSWASAIIVY